VEAGDTPWKCDLATDDRLGSTNVRRPTARRPAGLPFRGLERYFCPPICRHALMNSLQRASEGYSILVIRIRTQGRHNPATRRAAELISSRHLLDLVDLYVRHTSTPINAVLKHILPALEPTRYGETLAKFRNYQELWAPPRD